jgi:MerR family copper efflux transcriptional regulator
MKTMRDGLMSDGLTIGVLAARCGVSRDAIRFYEREGLLPRPRRTAARYRVYGDEDERRLRFVREAQGIGLTLDDIRELLRHEELRTPDECRRVAARLRGRIEAIDRKLAELRAFRSRLAGNLERCEKAEGQACPVVLDLSSAAARSREAEVTYDPGTTDPKKIAESVSKTGFEATPKREKE